MEQLGSPIEPIARARARAEPRADLRAEPKAENDWLTMKFKRRTGLTEYKH